MDLGFTQDAIAARLGISDASLSRWESGRREPSFSDLVRWGRALDMEIDLVARDPRPGGEVEMTDVQASALRRFAEVLPDLSDRAIHHLVALAEAWSEDVDSSSEG